MRSSSRKTPMPPLTWPSARRSTGRWQPIRRPRCAEGEGRRLGTRRHRPLSAGEAGSEGDQARRGRRSAHADSPALFRPHRPAADAAPRWRNLSRRAMLPARNAKRWSKMSSIDCWRRRSSASAGPGTGSTWCATPRAAGTSSITRSPMRTSIAITSSALSTAMCRTTSSSPSISPAICSRSRVWAQPDPLRGSARRTVSTNRSSAPASGSSARRSIRPWTFARTRPTASTTAST